MSKQKAPPKKYSKAFAEAGVFHTLKLTTPVFWNDEYINELEFRELRTRDLMEVTKHAEKHGNADVMPMFIQRSTLADPFVIEELTIADFGAAVQVIEDFLSKSLPALRQKLSQSPTSLGSSRVN